MSSRALRKAKAAVEAAGTEEAEAEEAGDPSSNRAGNQFALLMTEPDDNDAASGSGDDASPAAEAPEDAPRLEPAGQAGKKKAKKTRKQKKQQQQSLNGGAVKTRPVEDEFAELALPAAACEEGGGSGAGKAAAGLVAKPLLSVDLRLLDGGLELRRLFGHAAGEPAGSASWRQPGGRRGGGRRGLLLVQPKPTWPPVARLGLSMSPDPETFASDAFPAGSAVYRFEHSREYQRTQLDFAEAVDSGEPERLAEVLRRQPYHIDSLLQLAEVFRLQEDSATGADLVERALHAMECAMSPGFSLANDRCRLSFARRENRPMFSALLRHALALAGRCCHRACLETCKLLLSLSPTADPMGSLLLLDSACLMCGQEEFLLRLLQAWEPARHLSQLPNWAFSGALARFRLGRPDADAALDDALVLFPSVLPALLSRLSVDPGPAVSGCRLFADSEAAASPALKQLCGLFVQRCGHCWKEAPAVSFLVAGAARLAAAASATPPDPRVAECAERRLRRYRRTPRNVLRHLLASDCAREALADLPPGVDPSGLLNSFDPLPPEDSVCGYNLDALRRRVRGSAGADAAGAESGGLLTAFVRSLLPNYDPNAPAAPAGAAGGGPGGLAGLLDSVRQLLNGLGPPPGPDEGGGGVVGPGGPD